MRKIIHKLRKRKEEDRRALLHTLVFVFAVVLIFAWIYSLSARLSKNNNIQKLENSVEPFVELGNEIGEDFNDFRN